MEVNSGALPPLVFTCGQCHRILTDSHEFKCSIEDLEVVVMKGATGIAIDKIQQKCSLISANDSAYYSVLCDHCGIAVGRLYTKADESLHCLQGGFSFDAKAINSHQLGQCEVRALARAAEEGPLSAVSGAEGATETSFHIPAEKPANASEQILLDRLEQLEADLIKVQNILLLHNERLEAIESDARAPASFIDPTPGNRHHDMSRDPASQCHAGHDCDSRAVQGVEANGGTGGALIALELRGNEKAGPSCSLQLEDAPNTEQIDTGQEMGQGSVAEGDVVATGNNAQDGGRGQKRARKQSAGS